jgi:hypothetical protein
MPAAINTRPRRLKGVGLYFMVKSHKDNNSSQFGFVKFKKRTGKLPLPDMMIVASGCFPVFFSKGSCRTFVTGITLVLHQRFGAVMMIVMW